MAQNIFFVIFYVVLAILAYLLGSISPAIIISRAKGKDIMKEGSCNAGATNAIRVLGPKLGVCVFVLDVLKGFIPTFLVCQFFDPFIGYFVGVFIVIGHVFSIFHKFKAGKGVAPTIGVAFAAGWQFAIVCCALGIILVLITKRVSIGSIVAAASLPIVTWFMCPDFFFFALFLGLLLIFSHRANIKRLINGEEKPLDIFVRKSKKF